MFSLNLAGLKIKRFVWGLLLLGLFMLLQASWQSNTTAFGTVVTNGDISFPAPDSKAGKDMAKILNKVKNPHQN